MDPRLVPNQVRESPSESASSRDTSPTDDGLVVRKLESGRTKNDCFEQSVVRRIFTGEKVTLRNIAEERVDFISEKMQLLPEEYLEELKNELRVILEGNGESQQRKEFMVLQKMVQTRSDLTAETLLHTHRAQLEILVAIKMGIQAFLHPNVSLSQTRLIQIFGYKRCRNITCQNMLLVDDCTCDICTMKNGFCNVCMCVICTKFDFEEHTYRWIGCDLCSHWTHTECAIRDGSICMGTSTRSGTEQAEMLFGCRACNRTSELLGWVKDLFQQCAPLWKRASLMTELDVVRRIFRGSEDVKGRKLFSKCEELVEKLKGGLAESTAYKVILMFFQEDALSNLPEGMTDKISKKDEKWEMADKRLRGLQKKAEARHSISMELQSMLKPPARKVQKVVLPPPVADTVIPTEVLPSGSDKTPIPRLQKRSSEKGKGIAEPSTKRPKLILGLEARAVGVGPPHSDGSWEDLFRGRKLINEKDRFPSLAGASPSESMEICQALINWAPQAELEIPHCPSPSEDSMKFVRMVAGTTATLLGYWYRFDEMGERIVDQMGTIKEKNRELVQLKEALAHSEAEKKSLEVEVDRLRIRADEAEALGYERFRGHLRRAIPQYDPTTDWSKEFDCLLDWVRWVAHEERVERSRERASAPFGHAEDDPVPAGEEEGQADLVPAGEEEGQAGSASSSSSSEEVVA